MSNLRDFLGGLDPDTWTDVKAGYLDDNISTKAPASTALSTSTWTSARAENLDDLDATISSRAPSSTALSTATWTSARAAKLDSIDAAVSSRAPSSTALSNAVWTNTRAGYLDNLAGGVGGGYRPVANYAYTGYTTFASTTTSGDYINISVSIANYQNCIAVGVFAGPQVNAGIKSAISYRPVSNSVVRIHYYQNTTDNQGYAISVYRWG